MLPGGMVDGSSLYIHYTVVYGSGGNMQKNV